MLNRFGRGRRKSDGQAEQARAKNNDGTDASVRVVASSIQCHNCLLAFIVRSYSSWCCRAFCVAHCAEIQYYYHDGVGDDDVEEEEDAQDGDGGE